jgi:PTS system glucitol/sorbitol-specific IIA component
MVAHFNSETTLTTEGDLIVKYRGVIQEIGHMVEEFLPHGILIFFGATAPAELREVSLIHDGAQLHAPLVVGDMLQFHHSSIDEATQLPPMRFRLTAIGEVVEYNLAQLGHVVVHFDAATTATLPGAISVDSSLERLPLVGATFEILGLEKH